MGGIARRESSGHGNHQETPNRQSVTRKSKRSARENARGNAKEKCKHFGLIDGASDSVGNHVDMSE